MKIIFMISLLGLFVPNVMYAQLTKSQEGYIERKIAEAEAKHKKSVEAEKKKERETERRHEQQRIQHDIQFNRQMNNVNSVSAEDFLNTPQQQTGAKNFQATTYKAEESPKAPVATPRKNSNNRQASNNNGSGGRNNFGTPSYSGNNYSGNRYDFKSAGFGNTQQQPRAKVPASQIRGQYKSNRTMNQRVVNFQNTNQKPKVKVHGSRQQRNIAQDPQQPRSTQGIKKVQTSQQQQVIETPNKIKIAWIDGRVKHLDNSAGPVYVKSQSSSSADLKPVDTRRIDYATKIHNITVYNIPDNAYHLSDRDNKKTSVNVRQIANDERTQASQYHKMRQDAMDGFSSFNNRQKWEDIYGYEYYKTVKTSRTVTKKRN